MKLLRALAIPFTVAADIATLGNMGERSFTQQLFDADRREREEQEWRQFLRLAARTPTSDRENPYSSR